MCFSNRPYHRIHGESEHLKQEEEDEYHIDAEGLDDGEVPTEGYGHKACSMLLEALQGLDLFDDEVISCQAKCSGKWTSLKRVDRDWRTIKDNLKTSDAKLYKCMGKIFNVFDSQCAVLKGCLHDRLVNSYLAGNLAEAKEEMSNTITVLDSFFVDVSAPLGSISDELPGGPDVVTAMCDYISGESNSVPILVGNLVQSLKKSEMGWTYVRNLSLSEPNNLGWIPSWLASTVQERKEIGGDGHCSKELNRARKKTRNKALEWLHARGSNPDEDPEFTRCLEKVYKDVGKCCLRVKYRLHVLLQQRHCFQGALQAVECRVDLVLWRMDGLLKAISAPPVTRASATDNSKRVAYNKVMESKAEPMDLHSVEMDNEDAECYLFQVAHLDELVAVLDQNDCYL